MTITTYTAAFYGAKLWRSTDPRYRKTVFRCNAKYGKQATGCKTPYVSEQQIMDGFVIAVNRLIGMKHEFIAHLHEVSVRVFDTSELKARRDGLADEMAAISEEMEEAVCQTANGPVNQIEYGRRYRELADRYVEVKAEHDAAVERIRTKLSGAAATRRFIAVLNELDGSVTEFDPDLWGNLLDHVTVYTKQDLRYTFRNGTTIGLADEAGKERPAS